MGKNKNIKFKFIAVAIMGFVGAFLSSVSNGSFAYAETTTKTWIGTACAQEIPNCKWSETTNWQGGVVPVNGDNIVMNVNQTGIVGYSTDIDIANLVINNLTVSGHTTSEDGVIMIGTEAPFNFLTVTGDITLAETANPPALGYYNAISLLLTDNFNITLGADSTFTNVVHTGNEDRISLNEHSLTIKSTGHLATQSTYGFNYVITGHGTVNYELPITQGIFLNDSNDYSGTTNLISMDYASTTGSNYIAIFGTSDINIKPYGRLAIAGADNVTFSNKITIDPPAVAGTFLSDQITFFGKSKATVFTVPNITLLGNARLGTSHIIDGTTTVNLAGINANGHCIQYGGDGESGIFQNGPAACVVELAVTPTTTTTATPATTITAPNTVIQKIITANPITVAMLGFLSVIFVLVVRRQLGKNK